MDAAVPISPHRMVLMLNIRLQLQELQQHEHTHDGSHDRTFAVRPIALTHVLSYDHLTTRAMLSLHRTTLT